MTGTALAFWLLRRAAHGLVALLVLITLTVAIIGLAVTIRP